MKAPPRLTVLVVDDEPRSLETLRRTLDDAFDVVTAENAEAAIERMETDAVQLVLSDQRMPGMTGVEEVVISREVVEGDAKPLLIYSDREKQPAAKVANATA